MTVRIHLTGSVCVTAGGRVLREQDLPGRQGRVVLARLAADRGQPLNRENLAAALWSDEAPAAWDTALAALVSKLRSRLGELGVEGLAIGSTGGSYALRTPSGAWVDVEHAATALDEAEGALRAGEPGRAWGHGHVVAAITARPFLPGESSCWVEDARARLRRLRVRALECLAEVWCSTGEPHLAVEATAEVTRLEPFRETAHRLLMRAHVEAGNPAEALRAYERCRLLLAEELGVDPSGPTQELHRDLLGPHMRNTP